MTALKSPQRTVLSERTLAALLIDGACGRRDSAHLFNPGTMSRTETISLMTISAWFGIDARRLAPLAVDM